MLDNVPPPIPPLPNMGMLQRMPAQPGGVPITTQPMPMNVVPPASVPRPGMPPVMSGASPLPQQGLINTKNPLHPRKSKYKSKWEQIPLQRLFELQSNLYKAFFLIL